MQRLEGYKLTIIRKIISLWSDTNVAKYNHIVNVKVELKWMVMISRLRIWENRRFQDYKLKGSMKGMLMNIGWAWIARIWTSYIEYRDYQKETAMNNMAIWFDKIHEF